MSTTPTPPPPPTETPKRRWVVPTFVGVLSLLVGIGIGAIIAVEPYVPAKAGGSLDALPDTVETDVPESTPVAEPPVTVPDGPATFVVGDVATISEDDVETGTVTVEAVETRTTTGSEYGDPPANGQYWTVTVVATALPGQLFSINPFDFYLRDEAGNRYEYGGGNAVFESTDTQLNGTDLNGGETVRGTIVFDAPVGTHELVYAPGLRAIGVWRLVQS